MARASARGQWLTNLMQAQPIILAEQGVVHVAPIRVWGSDATGPATESPQNSYVPAQADAPAPKPKLEVGTENILGANAFSAGQNFFPTTFLGWSVLCLLLIVFVYLARRIYRKTHPKHPHHAHMPAHIIEN